MCIYEQVVYENKIENAGVDFNLDAVFPKKRSIVQLIKITIYW